MMKQSEPHARGSSSETPRSDAIGESAAGPEAGVAYHYLSAEGTKNKGPGLPCEPGTFAFPYTVFGRGPA